MKNKFKILFCQENILIVEFKQSKKVDDHHQLSDKKKQQQSVSILLVNNTVRENLGKNEKY